MDYQNMNEISLFLIFQKKGNFAKEIIEQAKTELTKRDLSIERFKELENEALELNKLIRDSKNSNNIEDAKDQLLEKGIEESVVELYVQKDKRTYEIPQIALIWLLFVVIGQVAQLFVILTSGMPVFSNPDFYIRIVLLSLVWFIYEQKRWALITFIILAILLTVLGFMGNSGKLLMMGLFHSLAAIILLVTEVNGRFYGRS